LLKIPCEQPNRNDQMAYAYSEDQLVEQPAIGLFAELGWATMPALQNLRRTRDPLLPRLLWGQVALASGANNKPGAQTL
jgi:hypothetical protein